MFIEIIPDAMEANSEGEELAQFPDLAKVTPSAVLKLKLLNIGIRVDHPLQIITSKIPVLSVYYGKHVCT